MHGGASGMAYLAMLGPAFIVSPGLLQKIYGARDERTVRIGVGLNALALLLFAFVPALLGMIARALHPGLANAELALPTVLTRGHAGASSARWGWRRVFSAEISSADAILFMLSTSLSQDLYKRFVDPEASDATRAAGGAIAAVAGGAAGIGLAIVSPTVIGSLSIFYTLLSVSLFVPILAGLYCAARRPAGGARLDRGRRRCLLAVHFATGGRGIGSLTPAMLGLLASAVGFASSLPAARRRAAATARLDRQRSERDRSSRDRDQGPFGLRRANHRCHRRRIGHRRSDRRRRGQQGAQVVVPT